MQIKIVNKINKSHIFFKNGGNMLKPNDDLEYKKNDVVFVKKDENGQFKIDNQYYIYDDIITELRAKNKIDRNLINKNLLINKFTNIFNLDKEYQSSDEEDKILTQINNQNKMFRKILNSRFNWIKFKGKINDKLVIGLGGQSVFETDITLHHIYGIPYIPGQALKGMFRNYIIQEYFKKCEHPFEENCGNTYEKNAIKDKKFRLIFGGVNDEGKNVAGKVIFMDTFICDKYKMKRDVMTPHHKNYYKDSEKSKVPLDSDEPNPIKFLVLNNDNMFEFNIAIDKRISEYTDKDIYNEREKVKLDNRWYKGNKITITQFILRNFIDSLNFYGIGAKTSVGYGYFDIDKEQVESKLKEEKQERLKQEEIFKKNLEQEEKFKEDTKDMSEFEVKLYKLNQIKDKDNQHRRITDFFSNIDNFEKENQEKLARYMKIYLEDDWKIKKNKKGQIKDKNSKRVKKICEILKIGLPE